MTLRRHWACQHSGHQHQHSDQSLNILISKTQQQNIKTVFYVYVHIIHVSNVCIYHDANLQYFQFSSHHSMPPRIAGLMTNLYKTLMGLLTENWIFMKFSPSYDNENVLQRANIKLRHDQWVLRYLFICSYSFKTNQNTQFVVDKGQSLCLKSFQPSFFPLFQNKTCRK